MQPPGTVPELIFELGKLQVFHYPTLQQIEDNLNPSNVFWQDTVSRHTYGPFVSIYVAMTHYTWMVKNQNQSEKPNADVVYIDFSTKKRIIYELPEGK